MLITLVGLRDFTISHRGYAVRNYYNLGVEVDRGNDLWYYFTN